METPWRSPPAQSVAPWPCSQCHQREMHQPKAVGPWSSPLSPWALIVELEVHPFHWRVKPASSVALTSLFSQLPSFGGRYWTHPHQLLRSSWCWSRTGPSQWGTSGRHDELLPIVSSQGRHCSRPWGLHPVPKILLWLSVEAKDASRWHASTFRLLVVEKRFGMVTSHMLSWLELVFWPGTPIVQQWKELLHLHQRWPNIHFHNCSRQCFVESLTMPAPTCRWHRASPMRLNVSSSHQLICHLPSPHLWRPPQGRCSDHQDLLGHESRWACSCWTCCSSAACQGQACPSGTR